MFKRKAFVELVRRVRPRRGGSEGENDAGSSSVASPSTRKQPVVELAGGSRRSGLNSMRFEVASAAGDSAEDEDEAAPASDAEMLDSGAEQDTQVVEESDEEVASSLPLSARHPTPGPSSSRSLSRRRSSIPFVSVPSRRSSLRTRQPTEDYVDDDVLAFISSECMHVLKNVTQVVMNDNSAVMSRSTGLLTPRITKTPSSSVCPPTNEDEDEEPPAQYEAPDDEIVESEELVNMLKEFKEDASESDEESDDDDDDDPDDRPVRFLDDFALYDSSTLGMEDFWRLALESQDDALAGRGIVASGIVSPRPRVDDDGEEIETGFDSDEAPRVRLTGILEIDYLWWYKDTETLDTDIWIRTNHAWYLLRSPCEAYRPFMQSFALAHGIVYELAEYALKHTRAWMSAFLDEVDRVHGEHETYLTRKQCEDAFKDVRVLHMIDNLRSDAPPIRKTTIFRRLETAPAPTGSAPPSRAISTYSGAATDYTGDEDESTSLSASTSKRPRVRRKSSSRNPERAILDEDKDKKTVLMPIIAATAQTMRHLKFKSVKAVRERQAEVLKKQGKKTRVHEFDPERIVWGRRIMRDDEGVGVYEWVDIDGVRYKPGDFVMVQPGEDGKATRAKAGETVHTTNALGHTNWFARIVYLHDGGNKKGFKFHAQWLTHSSKTMLQEFSHPNELLWLKECEDLVLASIIQKIDVKVLPVKGAVGEESSVGHLPDDHFFHRHLYYDEDLVAWADLPSGIATKALETCDPHKQCIPCGLHELDDQHEALTVLDDDSAFETGGVQYHRLECVYLYNEKDPNDAFQLAQVLEWRWKDPPKSKSKKKKGPVFTLTVKYFCRHDDVVAKERRAGKEADDWSTDERHIFLTGREEEVNADRVAGKFFVRRREPQNRDWLIDNPDVFYCTHTTDLNGKDVQSSDELEELLPRVKFERCEGCFDGMMQRNKKLRSLPALKGVEIFAGAGGFSEGMKRMVDTTHFIEYSPSCAKTLQANHPDAVVYNYDCNVVLQREIDVSEGKESEPLYGPDGSELPMLPEPGDVDIIYGGPPCQSFSKANHSKKADDPRSMLALVLLSYVERLQPTYVIIENVVGFAEHKAELEDGRIVDNAMLKVVPRCALALGYQVHVRVLQAAQYGVAQGRRRVIIIMAKRGVPLPQHPLQTHVHEPPQRVKLPTGVALRGVSRLAHGYLTEASRAAYCDKAPSAAPHRKVTVEQAVGDLPEFHWRRPGYELKITSAQRQEEANLRARGIPVIDAITPGNGLPVVVGFTESAPYGDIPRSLYQRSLRSEAPLADDDDGSTADTEPLVSMHYTKSFSAATIERVTAIPMVAEANWKDLPSNLPLKIGEKARERNAKPSKGTLRRLPADGVFATSMTNSYPLSKTGAALHYNQRRIITVREYARAQGFPDAYQLCSVNERPVTIVADQQRQVGNAVPVPLARAIGEQALRPAVLAWHEQQAREERDEDDGTPEI
ncbi:unnamed protein product [Peniophora sp. CBMAI 1063]|nr:unnamed protein product [Peniophora sp. CBMAI 1063]